MPHSLIRASPMRIVSPSVTFAVPANSAAMATPVSRNAQSASRVDRRVSLRYLSDISELYK